jgi:hypothetical protein
VGGENLVISCAPSRNNSAPRSMPIEKARLFHNVVMKLSVLRYMVKARSKRGLTDLNRDCESFIRDVLNIVYGYELVNLNHTALNSAAIDLADDHARLAVQVTASSEAAKIKKTLEKFIAHELDKNYDTLMVMMLVEKKDYRTKFESTEKLSFDPAKHVLDVDDVIAATEKLGLDELQRLSDFVDRELPSVSRALEPESLLAQAEQVAANPPVSAASFLENMEIEPGTKDWEDELSRVRDLFAALCGLSKNQRELIAFIMVNGKESRFGGRCAMAIQTVEQKLRLSRLELGQYFAALEQEGLLDVDGEGTATNFELSFGLSSGNDAFSALKYYLKTKEAIAKVIVECDFTALD